MRVARPAPAHLGGDFRGFGGWRRGRLWMHRHSSREPGARRERRQIADGRQPRVILRRKHRRAVFVDPVDEFRSRAKIAPQPQRLQAQRAHALVAGAQEQAHLGFAELVDRLHRIAHREQRAPVTRLPAGGQRAQQLELLKRGILEFIDEDVADGAAATQGQIRRLALLGQCSTRRRRDRREVDTPLRGELELQLRRCEPQQLRQGRKGRRVRGGNADIGQCQQLPDQLTGGGQLRERGDPFGQLPLLLPVFREQPLVLVPGAPPLARRRHCERAHAAPARQLVGQRARRAAPGKHCRIHGVARGAQGARRVPGQIRPLLEERSRQPGSGRRQPPLDQRAQACGNALCKRGLRVAARSGQHPRQPVRTPLQHQHQQRLES